MLFKSGVFSFFPLPLYCLSSWSFWFVVFFFFFLGVLLLHLYTKPTKRFWLLLCRLGWSIKELGVGRRGAREKSARHRMTHSVSFSLALSDVRAFSEMCSEVLKPAVPPGCVPPLDGTIRGCLLVDKLESGRSHPSSDVEFALPGAELNWHLASSLRVALNLHINLHRSLIGDKCTCFLFIELCKCIHRFT